MSDDDLEVLFENVQNKRTLAAKNSHEIQWENTGEIMEARNTVGAFSAPGSFVFTSFDKDNVSNMMEDISVCDFLEVSLSEGENKRKLRLVQPSDPPDFVPHKTTFNRRKQIKETEAANSEINEVNGLPSPPKNLRLSHQLQKCTEFSADSYVGCTYNHMHLHKRKSQKSVHISSPVTFPGYKFHNNKQYSVPRLKRELNFCSDSSMCSNSPTNNLLEVKENKSDPVMNFFESYQVDTDSCLYRQFKLQITEVLHDGYSENLISKEEMDIINSFNNMDSACQDLYARMHNRNFKWNRVSNIEFDVATEENVQTLEERGFLSTDLQQVEIENLLELLNVWEVKDVCKSLSLNWKVQHKMNCAEDIIHYCLHQKAIKGSGEIVVRKRIREFLGLCFILQPEPRDLFRRIHLLFNLKFSKNELSRYGSQDLFDIQYFGTISIFYPEYQIDENARIFASRAELLRYQAAEDLKYEYLGAVESREWNMAEKILDTARKKFIRELDLISKLERSGTDESYGSTGVSAAQLPLSLRIFTPGAVYAFIVSDGVDVLKKLKKNNQAIHYLTLLLNQNTYLPYSRRQWFEKLISFHQMNGNLNEVANTICTAVFDPYIDDQGFCVMSCRIKGILKRNQISPEKESLLRDILQSLPLQPEERVVIRAIPLVGKVGFKQEKENGDGKASNSVTELVRNYYCPRIFKKGINAESILAISLFGILFWDVIYEHYVPYAFLSPFQTKPWDLSSGEFYKNRQDAIDKKLEEIPKWTSDEIASWVKQIYDKNIGKSSLVNWTLFHGYEEILDIINCIGLKLVLKICERLAKKYHSVRSGFPELFFWTPGRQNEYIFVEVKRRNNKLRVEQNLWLDFLVNSKANVEICWVQAQKSKTTEMTLVPVPDIDCLIEDKGMKETEM